MPKNNSKNHISLLILIAIFANCQMATAQIKLHGNYHSATAQNFAHCPTHFYKNTPPSLDLAKATSSQLYQLCFNGFASLYSGLTKTALFSAEHLTDKRLKLADKMERVDSFRRESRLPVELQVDQKSYQNQGFDKGHLAPNADMDSLASQYDSFSLANIIPQNPDHNRNLWRHIEQQTRALTLQFGESYVVTGVLFNGKQVAVMNGVYVPSHIFKAVYLPSQQVGAVYYSPNDNSGAYYLVSLDEFAKMTGIVPFVGVATSHIPPNFALSISKNEQNPAPTGILGWARAMLTYFKHKLAY